MPTFLVKPLIYLLAFLTFGGVCFYKGCTYSEGQYKAAAAIQAAENAEKLAEIQAESDAKTRALYAQLLKAKKGNSLPDRALLLSADFCRMYNAGAGLPETPCPNPVAVEVVADTTRDNFAACRQNAIWLEECQSVCR